MHRYIRYFLESPSEFLRKARKRLKDPRKTRWLTRPFKAEDLCPVPAGWRIGPPGYIGIGTSKAGTSWWHQLILEHPQVEDNRLRCKELEFFTHFLFSGMGPADVALYRQAFAAPPGSLSGEFTPGYLRTPLAAEFIHEAAPDARLIAILRNPVDQAQSALNQMMYTAAYYGLSRDQRHVFYNYTAAPDALSFNVVSGALARYLQLFGSSQLLVLQYERCAADPSTEIRKTYEFLGIDPDFDPPSLRRMVNKVAYRVEAVSAAHRRRLARFYQDDVCATVRLFPHIDVGLWPDFQN